METAEMALQTHSKSTMLSWIDLALHLPSALLVPAHRKKATMVCYPSLVIQPWLSDFGYRTLLSVTVTDMVKHSVSLCYANVAPTSTVRRFSRPASCRG